MDHSVPLNGFTPNALCLPLFPRDLGSALTASVIPFLLKLLRSNPESASPLAEVADWIPAEIPYLDDLILSPPVPCLQFLIIYKERIP